MKNITLSASEALIERAREKARLENTTLNNRFREWLETYTYDQIVTKKQLDSFFDSFKIKTGGPFKREEMNERR